MWYPIPLHPDDKYRPYLTTVQVGTFTIAGVGHDRGDSITHSSLLSCRIPDLFGTLSPEAFSRESRSEDPLMDGFARCFLNQGLSHAHNHGIQHPNTGYVLV